MATDGATRFHLVVRYDWKPHVDAARVAYHAAKIRALPARVPNLLDARFGPRPLGHPAEEAQGRDHAAVLIFRSAADYAAFGPTQAHDDVAIELAADLERIEYLGLAG
jgi:hypothetical protein